MAIRTHNMAINAIVLAELYSQIKSTKTLSNLEDAYVATWVVYNEVQKNLN